MQEKPLENWLGGKEFLNNHYKHEEILAARNNEKTLEISIIGIIIY